MGWTDERVETLKRLWLDGLSASQVAKSLGGGVTRNAVIGKVHRLGLSGRAAPSQPQRPVMKTPRPARLAPVAPPVRRVDAVAVATTSAVFACEEAGSATVLTLGAHMCKWPLGDPALDGFTFCGRRMGTDGPYCVEHAKLAYQPQQKRARRPEPTDHGHSVRRYI